MSFMCWVFSKWTNECNGLNLSKKVCEWNKYLSRVVKGSQVKVWREIIHGIANGNIQSTQS